MKPDAVQQILKVVGETAGIEPQALARCEQAIRREFGGAALRIQPRAPITIDDIDARLRQRKPVAAISVELGLSRATIYRMLARKSRKPGGNETAGGAK